MDTPIPQFSLARQLETLRPALEPAIARVLASGRFVLGPECEALESEIVAALGVPGLAALACASGTDALLLSLRAVNLQPGDAVVTTPFTFFATASAIMMCGATPVFSDIDPIDFNMSPGALADTLRQQSKARVAAIIPVDLYGQVAAMREICEIAAKAEIPVVEDAAQAYGAWRPDAGCARPAGAWGQTGCFSFYPTKNLGALGEGGLVTTSSAEILDRLRLLRVHGSRRRYEHETLGWNARMHEFQAAILRAKLPQVADWTRRRQEIAAAYEDRLLQGGRAAVANAACAELVNADAGIAILLPARSPGHVFHQYVIRARRRDELRQYLHERQIGSDVYYPTPLHRQPALRTAVAAGATFPAADRAAEEVLALPMFPELRLDEVDRVTGAIAAFYTEA